MPAVLRLEDVSRHVRRRHRRRPTSTSTVERGEFVTLLGPSGCGKTTTLRMVAGLEQNTAGRISIGDRVVSDAAAGFFVPPDHRQLGMVFQSYAIWPHMTVFDNVAYPLRIRRRPRRRSRSASSAALRLVEMEHYRRPAGAGTLRRPAAARRDRARAGVRAGGAAARRAAVQSRRAAAHADGRRVPRAAEAARHHQPLCHPRPGRGDGAVRPRRRDAGRPASCRSARRRKSTSGRSAARSRRSSARPTCSKRRSPTARPVPDGTFQVGVAGQGWQGQARAGEKFEPGEQVVVLVRPENVRIGQWQRQRRRHDVERQGRAGDLPRPRTSIAVETGGPRLNVEAPALAGVRVGDDVKLSVPQAGAWAIQPEARS